MSEPKLTDEERAAMRAALGRRDYPQTPPEALNTGWLAARDFYAARGSVSPPNEATVFHPFPEDQGPPEGWPERYVAAAEYEAAEARVASLEAALREAREALQTLSNPEPLKYEGDPYIRRMALLAQSARDRLDAALRETI